MKQWQQDSLNECLHDAAIHGDIHTVRLAIQQGAEVNHRNEYGETALWLASKNGQCEIVRYLVVVANADIHIQAHYMGLIAMQCAEWMGHKSIAEFLQSCADCELDTELASL